MGATMSDLEDVGASYPSTAGTDFSLPETLYCSS